MWGMAGWTGSDLDEVNRALRRSVDLGCNFFDTAWGYGAGKSEAILGDLVDLVTKHLKKGDRIRLVGLGVLVVRKRAARMGRNPATGEPIQIKASKKVAFRAAKELKEAV